jgi:nucleoside-triphosphatase THEP1
MELFSESFKRVTIEAFDSENKVIATILFTPNSFCDKLKRRTDTKVLYLTRNNFQEIKKEILNYFN